MTPKHRCKGILKNGENCKFMVKKENIDNDIYYCVKHMGQYSNKSEKIIEVEKNKRVNSKENKEQQRKSSSLILCLKSKDSSNIIHNFLKSYSKYHNFNYNKLNLNNIENFIENIENCVKNYKNILIYYTGNGFNNCEGLNDPKNNVFDFPSFELKENIFDQHELMEYLISFVSGWDKKFILIFDCDNSEKYKYKENIDPKYKENFKKCDQKINIFDTINYPIKICSVSKNKKNKSSGLFTLTLFKYLKCNLIETLNELKNNFSLLYDEYKDVPEDFIKIARENGFEVSDNGTITNFK